MRGKLVKELREKLNLTQQDLENGMQDLGYVLHRARISVIERQEEVSVEDSTLYGLAKVLKVSPAYLMGDNTSLGEIQIEDQELHNFFAGDWNSLDESEREWVRRAVRIAKSNLNSKGKD